MPTLADMMAASVDYHFPQIRGDLFQRPHLHSRIVNSNICPSYKLPNESFLYELNWTTFHYRDKFHNFHGADGFFDNNEIHKEVLFRIRNRTAYFLITVLYEGYMDDDFLDHMSDYFTSKSIPLTQIIYLSNCYNGKEIYKDYCQRKNKLAEMNMEYFPIFRIDKCDVQSALNKITEYKTGTRKKTFLCFNRRYNDHRLMLYLQMVKTGLIDQSYYSMDKTQPESNRSFVDNCKYLLSRFADMDLNAADVLVADNLLPLILDNPNFNNYPMEQSVDPVQHFYNNSLVNIVTETYFFNNIIHITEKTYKPIAFKQPFVMIAAPGSLQHVKDMGFKTFNEFWDESYDQEKDHKIRFRKILKVLEEVNSWSDEIKADFTYVVKDILEYNASHLNTMKNIEIDNLVEKYGT
jgi:hypothetical protein